MCISIYIYICIFIIYIYAYLCMYFITIIPRVFAYFWYITSCRISTVNRRTSRRSSERQTETKLEFPRLLSDPWDKKYIGGGQNEGPLLGVHIKGDIDIDVDIDTDWHTRNMTGAQKPKRKTYMRFWALMAIQQELRNQQSNKVCH